MKVDLKVGILVLAASSLISQYAYSSFLTGWAGNKSFSVCAEEVVEGNIMATDRIIHEAALSEDFKSAQYFQQEVTRITQISDLESKFAEYLGKVGVDASDPEKLLAFLGAKADERSSYIQAAQTNLQLSPEQAEKLTSRIVLALKGERRDQ